MESTLPASARPSRVLRVVLALSLILVAASCRRSKSPSKLRADPGHYYDLGLQFLHQGRPDRAVVELEKAVKGDPDSPVVSYSLGLAYYGVRDLTRAQKTLQRVLAIDPFFTDAHNSLGIIYGDMGDLAKARAEFERVLADRNYATPEVARLNLAKVLTAHGSLEEAVPHFRAAVDKKPERSDWRLQLGLALEQLGRFEAAATEFAAVTAAEPASVDAWFHLGYVSSKLTDAGKARECFRRVIELAPASELGIRSSELLAELGS